MWFAKWFGGRDKEHEDDEPARFPASTAVQPSALSTRSASQIQSKPAGAMKKGFDPYNSGAFERRNAWERTNRR
jgi:hypothetical protein